MWPVCLSIMPHPALMVPGCSAQSGARFASLPVLPRDISFDNSNKSLQAAPFGTIIVLVKWFGTLSSGLCPLTPPKARNYHSQGPFLPFLIALIALPTAWAPGEGMESRGAKETYK